MAMILYMLLNLRVTIWGARHHKHGAKAKLDRQMCYMQAECPCGKKITTRSRCSMLIVGPALKEMAIEENERNAKRDKEVRRRIYDRTQRAIRDHNA